jgi:hypothetical protein
LDRKRFSKLEHALKYAGSTRHAPTIWRLYLEVREQLSGAQLALIEREIMASWVRKRIDTCIALNLLWFEAHSGLRLVQAVLDPQDIKYPNPNRCTWAIGWYGISTKMMMTEHGELSDPISYGTSLVIMLKDYQSLNVYEREDQAWQSSFEEIIKRLKSMQEAVGLNLSLLEPTQRQAVMESDCLSLLDNPEECRNRLARWCREHQDLLVTESKKDPVVSYDTIKDLLEQEPELPECDIQEIPSV